LIVVADTSPINYLIRLNQADILSTLFGRVVVPSAVMTELLHVDAPDEVRDWVLHKPEWLDVVTVQYIAPRISQELGRGEVEAISLALERHASALLIDDWAGREQAQACGVRVNGTLAILLQAGLLKLLNFEVEIERLRRLGFRASPALISTMTVRYGQAQYESQHDL
jgi:predicted nucleic acid-binding protein